MDKGTSKVARGPREKHLTEAKVRRAIEALVEVMETPEGRAVWDRGVLDAACDHLRKLETTR